MHYSDLPRKEQWCKQDFFLKAKTKSQDQGKTKTSKIFPSQDQDFFQDQDQDFVTSLDSHHSRNRQKWQ